MAFAVSIGDAFLMAKVALKIGQAFSRGIKSAPAQVREIESLLYSLSVALNAIGMLHRPNQHSSPVFLDQSKLPNRVPSQFAGNSDVLVGMLQSCQETLSHLEKILERYSMIGDTSNSPNSSSLRAWSRELKVNWRKITWTTEGGDLAELKSTLTIYTNSLNLVLSVITNKSADKLGDNLGDVSVMLHDIHKWFVENLRDGNKAVRTPTSSEATAPSDVDFDEPPDPVFQLYQKNQQNQQTSTCVCPAASYNFDVVKIAQEEQPHKAHLFSCHCLDKKHATTLRSYRLSPFTFAARIAGNERSWLIHAICDGVTDQIVSLVIKGVPTPDAFSLERQLVDSLGIIQATRMFRRLLETGTDFTQDLDKSGSKANVIHLVGNAQNSTGSLQSVKFKFGNAYYQRSAVQFIQILQYKSISLEQLQNGCELRPNLFQIDKTGDISIFYGQMNKAPNDRVVRSVLKLRWNSELEHQREIDTVLVKDVECTAFGIDESPISSARADVFIEFTDPSVARQFHTEAEAVRMELFVIHLQYQREDETAVLQLQVKDVHTERMLIRAAELTIFRNMATGLYRFLLRSQQGYPIISQEFNDNSLRVLLSNDRSDHTIPSYEVFIDGTGVRRIRRCPQGLGYLKFSDLKVYEIYKTGLRLIMGPST